MFSFIELIPIVEVMKFISICFLFFTPLLSLGFSGDDMLPQSLACTSFSNPVPNICTRSHGLNEQSRRLSDVEKSTQDLSFSTRVKRANLEQAKQSFVENVAMANWIFGNSIYKNRNSIRMKMLTSTMELAEKNCSGSLKGDFESLVKKSEEKTLSFGLGKVQENKMRNEFQKRYLIAALEADRLTVAIPNNYFHGEEKIKAQRRLAMLYKHYPMLGNSSLNLRNSIEVEYQIFSSNTRTDLESPWIEDCLFPDPITKQFKQMEVPKSARSSVGQVAQKISKIEKLPERIERELKDKLQISVESNVKAIGELCKADECTTYGLSLENTAKILNDEKDQSHRLSSICKCSLRNVKEMMDPRITYAAIGAGLGSCFFFPVSCPAVGAILATSGAVQSLHGGSELARAYEVKKISDTLPGVRVIDKKENNKFATDATVSVGTDAVGTIVAQPVAKVIGIAGTAARNVAKKVRLKFLDAKSYSREIKAKYPGLTDDEIAAIVSKVQKTGEAPIEILQTIGDKKVVKYINRDGDEYIMLEAVSEKSMIGTVQKRALFIDSKTKAIDANDEVGRKLIKELVEKGDGEVSVIFLDVNNLGKVNYFHQGQQAGDDYLEAVGSSISEHLRKGDLLFKTGGDELVIIVKTKDPAIVKSIQERIVDTVHQSPHTARVFQEEAKYIRNLYDKFKGATSFESFDKDMISKLKPGEAEIAKANFAAFKQAKLADISSAIQSQEILHPSVSIGGKIVGKGETYEASKTAAEAQAKDVKIDYKGEAGVSKEELAKYGAGGSANAERRELAPGEKPKPRVREPIPAAPK